MLLGLTLLGSTAHHLHVRLLLLLLVHCQWLSTVVVTHHPADRLLLPVVLGLPAAPPCL